MHTEHLVKKSEKWLALIKRITGTNKNVVSKANKSYVRFVHEYRSEQHITAPKSTI